ncbi:MAG TPA: DinB family protein [Verrucomicrobiae bacterium]|nr:DinB family protein [Verrucomicrobiae bacterium]
MTTDDVRLLFEFDRWANHGMLQLVEPLTAEQFTRDLGGSYHSVRDVLCHIVGGKWSWLTYWNEPSPSDPILDEIFARSAARFAATSFPTLAAVRATWIEVEKEQIEFVNRATDEHLRRKLPVRHTSISLAHLMQHVVNHSTYHRGQVAMMLRQLGATAEGTDFCEFFLATSKRS